MASLVLRSNKIKLFVSDLIPHLAVPFSSELHHRLLCLVCSYRYHKIMADVCSVISAKIPTFFLSGEHAFAVSKGSALWLQFVGGSSSCFGAHADTPDMSYLYRVFWDVACLSMSTVLELARCDSTAAPSDKPFLQSDIPITPNEGIHQTLSMSLQSHARVLILLLDRHPYRLVPELRAQIDEAAVRLLWLCSHTPSPHVSSSVALRHTLSALRVDHGAALALLSLLDSSLFGVHRVPSAYLQAASAVVEDLGLQICGFSLRSENAQEASLSLQLSSLLRKLKTEQALHVGRSQNKSFDSSEQTNILAVYAKAFNSQLDLVQDECLAAVHDGPSGSLDYQQLYAGEELQQEELLTVSDRILSDMAGNGGYDVHESEEENREATIDCSDDEDAVESVECKRPLDGSLDLSPGRDGSEGEE